MDDIEARLAKLEKELSYLIPRVTESQATSGKALSAGQAALQNSLTALKHVNLIYLQITDIKKAFGNLSLSILNGLKRCGEHIVEASDFIEWKDPGPPPGASPGVE